MKRMLILAFAVVALVFTTTDASAQHFTNGYNFGAGVQQSARRNFRSNFGGGCFAGNFGYRGVGITDRVSEPPYFAKFPPVYYSGIVRRPYGVSPYAAPAGIAPVELNMPVSVAPPVTIRNPYANNSQPVSALQEQPVRAKKADATKLNNKTTKVTNPFFVQQPTEVADVATDAVSILLVNAEVE